MLNSLETVIVVPIFIMIVIASQKAIEEGFKITGITSWILAVCVAELAITCFDPVWHHPALEFMLSCWILGLLILIIFALGDLITTIDKENNDVT